LKFNHEHPPVEPVDYLAIGHVSQDITPDGLKLGGTVSFAGLTALSFGMRVGIVTTAPETIDLTELGRIDFSITDSPEASTFENIQTPLGRVQVLHSKSNDIYSENIPQAWLKPGIVHLAPLCRELDPAVIHEFPDAFIGVTPQGWMRTWDETGRVSFGEWLDADPILEKASAVILSLEDVHNDENRIESLIPKTRVLVITEGAAGARVYWNGDVRHIKAPTVQMVEPTGAGDIFAAAFFIRLHQTHDPWTAARFAVRIASTSVTRVRIDGVPTPEEIQAAMSEIITD
jgi:hypothetical protein